LPEAEHDLHRSAQKLCTLFKSHFGSGEDSEVAFGFVPGRIEVAGKHTDYSGGHTLVCAIDRGFLFVAGRNPIGRIRIVEDSTDFVPLEFPFSLEIEPAGGLWANYPMTMAKRIAANFSPGMRLHGVDIAFASTLPVGSGMSGSSALMIMCFCAITLVNRLHEYRTFRENIRNGIDLAMYLACAENGQSFRDLAGGSGVGTFGGSEDHTAILECKAGTLSLYQYAPTIFKANAAWPPSWSLVIAFSGVRAEKTGRAMEEYNLASQRASRAVSAYNRLHRTDFQCLGDIEKETRGTPLTAWLNQMDEGLAKERDLDLSGRIRHFLREERDTTPRGVQAILWRDLKAFGAALSASHRASRRQLWNIVPEIDFLQCAAVKLGAAGASGFGAGFGGSIFAVIRKDQAEQFAAAWEQAYAERYPERHHEAVFFVSSPGPGARLWDELGPSRFVDRIFQA
jgi:galactokinase